MSNVLKDLKCVWSGPVRSGLVWSVPIEFPRMCISVNPRNCTYAFPHRFISTFQEYFTLAFNSTSIGGLRRIKISLLIRSQRSAPPLFYVSLPTP